MMMRDDFHRRYLRHVEAVRPDLQECRRHRLGSQHSCSQSRIRGTNGSSNGLVPMLLCSMPLRATSTRVAVKKGLRYHLEPWHADIVDFSTSRRTMARTRTDPRPVLRSLDPDLFMKRVEANGDWTLMCPNECPDCHQASRPCTYEREAAAA